MSAHGKQIQGEEAKERAGHFSFGSRTMSTNHLSLEAE